MHHSQKSAAKPFLEFFPHITSANGHYEHPPPHCISRPCPRLLHNLPTRSRNPPPRPFIYNPRLPRWPPGPHPDPTPPIQSQKARRLQTHNFDTPPAPLARPCAHTVGERQQHKHATERGERGTVSGRAGQDEAGRCGDIGCGERRWAGGRRVR